MKLTVAAALAGAADAAGFAYSRREVMRRNPGRAAGTLASVGLWAALAGAAMRGDRRRARALSTAALLANGAMLGVHLRARIAAPRVWLGSGLAAAALIGTAGRQP